MRREVDGPPHSELYTLADFISRFRRRPRLRRLLLLLAGVAGDIVMEILKMNSGGMKAAVLKINVVFLAVMLLVFMALVLEPRAASILDGVGAGGAEIVRCAALRECRARKRTSLPVTAAGSSVRFLDGAATVGLVGISPEEAAAANLSIGAGGAVVVELETVSEMLRWEDLFPEWVDEEEESDGPSCPELPMPDFAAYGDVDAVVARLPCRYPEKGWRRDVRRLQLHLAAAGLAARNGRRIAAGEAVRVALLSPQCEPMTELFPCDEKVGRDGEWHLYHVRPERLLEKLRLPLGSCNLAVPLWDQGIDSAFNVSALAAVRGRRREAYATVIHSSTTYLCGAVMLAHSIRLAGTTRDLVLLHDHSIPRPALRALAAAGWLLRKIKRIRNPRAAAGTYNEYNYSKFRLWQLTDYAKVIFIDADIIVLRSLDFLFAFPQMSAVGNDASIFNSGVMVIEPSNCTFELLLRNRRSIVSYNGGDQGFLNEVFVYWHRLPRRVNYLKNFWANTSSERARKESLFGARPAKLYALHYLGLKPWNCYRDYDCNWDIGDQRVYASDVAHRRWWELHDEMPPELQEQCRLTEKRRVELQWDRKMAGQVGFPDEHWRINVTDRRNFPLP